MSGGGPTRRRSPRPGRCLTPGIRARVPARPADGGAALARVAVGAGGCPRARCRAARGSGAVVRELPVGAGCRSAPAAADGYPGDRQPGCERYRRDLLHRRRGGARARGRTTPGRWRSRSSATCRCCTTRRGWRSGRGSHGRTCAWSWSTTTAAASSRGSSPPASAAGCRAAWRRAGRQADEPAALTVFERTFGTPHGASIEHLAGAFGIPYTLAARPGDVAKAIAATVSGTGPAHRRGADRPGRERGPARPDARGRDPRGRRDRRIAARGRYFCGQTPRVRCAGQDAATCQSKVTVEDAPAAFVAVTLARYVNAPNEDPGRWRSSR